MKYVQKSNSLCLFVCRFEYTHVIWICACLLNICTSYLVWKLEEKDFKIPWATKFVQDRRSPCLFSPPFLRAMNHSILRSCHKRVFALWRKIASICMQIQAAKIVAFAENASGNNLSPKSNHSRCICVEYQSCSCLGSEDHNVVT